MITLLLTYRYFIIIPLTMVEGPIVMMVGGLLLRLGYFDFLPLYLCLVLSDFVADLIWYGIGYYFGEPFIKKFGKFFSITEHGVGIVKKIFYKYQDKILIISKLTTGFGFAVATLFTAGLIRIPFKRYAMLNFIGGFIWAGFLMAVGYYLGDAYTHVNNVIGKLSVFGIIISIFIALYGIGKYIKGRTIKTYS